MAVYRIDGALEKKSLSAPLKPRDTTKAGDARGTTTLERGEHTQEPQTARNGAARKVRSAAGAAQSGAALLPRCRCAAAAAAAAATAAPARATAPLRSPPRCLPALPALPAAAAAAATAVAAAALPAACPLRCPATLRRTRYGSRCGAITLRLRPP